MREKVVLREIKPNEIINRQKPTCDPKDYKPFDMSKDGIAPLASYGSEYVFRVSGSTHDETGFPNNKPENADKYIRHYTDKIEKNKKDIVITREYNLEDAEYVIIAYGCTTRSALDAMKMAREKGGKVGVLQLVTLWPFADDEVRSICKKSKGIIVPEMNLGQIIGEVQRLNDFNTPIFGVNKVNSEAIDPREILEKIQEVGRSNPYEIEELGEVEQCQ